MIYSVINLSDIKIKSKEDIVLDLGFIFFCKDHEKVSKIEAENMEDAIRLYHSQNKDKSAIFAIKEKFDLSFHYAVLHQEYDNKGLLKVETFHQSAPEFNKHYLKLVMNNNF